MALIAKCVADWASCQPDKLALISVGGESLTYSQLYNLCQRISANLVAHLMSSTRSDSEAYKLLPIILLCDDNTVSVATVIACNMLGLLVAPINPDIGREALESARNAIGARQVIYGERYEEISLELETASCHALSIQRLVKDVNAALTEQESDPESPFLLSLSSGSTGDPKPVIFTDSGKLQRALRTADEFKFNKQDVILCASPFYHSLGQRLTFMPLVLGATMVQLPLFSAGAWLDAVASYYVSVTICVSSHLFALKQLLIEKDPRTRSIRSLVSSSASIDNTTKSALFDNTHFAFYEMYGASEVATATQLNNSDPVSKRGSVGRVCAGVKIKIVDNERRPLTQGQLGEIAVNSPLCTPGYYARSDLDVKAFDDGWFFTGDLGQVDDDGYLHFIDRCADCVITGGSNVFPSDIEASLRKHPRVRDCLVIGIDDSYLGEAVAAIIIDDNPVSGVNLERELRKHVRESLASYQQPLMYFLVETFALNGAGKIDRKRIKAHYNNLGHDPSARFRDVLLARSN